MSTTSQLRVFALQPTIWIIAGESASFALMRTILGSNNLLLHRYQFVCLIPLGIALFRCLIWRMSPMWTEVKQVPAISNLSVFGSVIAAVIGLVLTSESYIMVLNP